uniref:Alpha-N-acetylglucosaminidase tim-barrel domain-containing protein n=1 Tax=Timema shepardi TaxID=629360 RepID=A0A7R9AWU4_TIMSH|nr:unnamed protein product [Timema shepardi]
MANEKQVSMASEQTHAAAEEIVTLTSSSVSTLCAKLTRRDDVWCVDSGATTHMCRDKNSFLELTPTISQKVIAEFGTDHVYNCDTFNEMVPSSGELDYLSAVGHATFQAMIDIDPTAICTPGQDSNLDLPVAGDPVYCEIIRLPMQLNLLMYFQGRMLVLDLQSEQYEQYTTYSSYFGQPFIWCMLHNFGGTLGLFGSMSIINQKVFVARALPNGTLVGTGLTPEGINQNYVIYDLMTEMSWRTEPTNLTQW